ncbi:MAG: hypothetical protein NTZ37_00225 [Methanoregula sp.]|nr:hypothetical protein [Methanoregula sp.]
MPNEEADDFFHYFIKRNFAVISIIGIFLAVSKYFYGDGTDVNSVGISIIATIFAIFLLIVLLIDSMVCLIKSTKEEFQKPIIKFSVSYLPYIAVIITICFIAFLVYALSWTAAHDHPTEVNLIILIIELFSGFFVAAVVTLYVLIRVNEPLQLGAIFLFSTIVMFVLFYGFNLQNLKGADIINQPFSKAVWVIGLLPIIELIWFTSFIKIIIKIQKIVSEKN